MIKYEIILGVRLCSDVYVRSIVKVHYVVYYVHVLRVLLMLIVHCLLVHECLWKHIASAYGTKQVLVLIGSSVTMLWLRIPIGILGIIALVFIGVIVSMVCFHVYSSFWLLHINIIVFVVCCHFGFILILQLFLLVGLLNHSFELLCSHVFLPIEHHTVSAKTTCLSSAAPGRVVLGVDEGVVLDFGEVEEVVFEHLLGGDALFRLPLEDLEQETLGGGGDVVREFEVCTADALVELFVVLTSEGKTTAKQSEKQDTKSPDISRRTAVFFLADNLWCHVRRSATEQLDPLVIGYARREPKVN